MKNTLTINTLNDCACDCLDSVYDGSNSLLLYFIVDRESKVTFSNGKNFTITPQISTIVIPPEWYLRSDLKFVFSNDDHTSNEFTIKKPTTTDGNMTLQMIDNFVYQVRFYKQSGGGGGDPYILPKATATTLGGVYVDEALSAASENPVQNKVVTDKLNEVFQSVSNGKTLIAAAITDKGVGTAADATFGTMANNIRQIKSGVSHSIIDLTIDLLRYETI